jgi:UDPglucose--hexose-1-phosphate uridylyltransferase
MAPIVKREFSLSDGRDLIYFDDADTSLPPDRLPDRREPTLRAATATMRQDVLTGEWISIAATRANRVFLPPAEADPLAPASATNPSEIPSNYDVAVFENKSPSFGPLLEADDAAATVSELSRIGLGRTRRSVGRCEVVCFSPENEGSFGSLTPSRARTVIEAWADRTAQLSALPNIQQVFPFENRGEAIGVTLRHPHGQIYAYPYITPRTTNLIRSLDEYGPSLFADILEFERRSPRVILSGEHWTAFVPFAARWPIEVHMLPHRHVPDFAATTGAERDELALLYLRLLRGVDALYETPTPYIAAWHQAPAHTHRDDIRMMLQVTSPRRAADKLKYLAGSESAMGAWIGDIPPEQAADSLRAAIAIADVAHPVVRPDWWPDPRDLDRLNGQRVTEPNGPNEPDHQSEAPNNAEIDRSNDARKATE